MCGWGTLLTLVQTANAGIPGAACYPVERRSGGQERSIGRVYDAAMDVAPVKCVVYTLYPCTGRRMLEYTTSITDVR